MQYNFLITNTCSRLEKVYPWDAVSFTIFLKPLDFDFIVKNPPPKIIYIQNPYAKSLISDTHLYMSKFKWTMYKEYGEWAFATFVIVINVLKSKIKGQIPSA